MEVTTRPLTREQLSDFLPNHRSIVAFENAQKDIGTQGDVFSTAPFVTTDTNTNLNSARVLTGDEDVSVTDDAIDHTVTLGLTDTGVTPDTYGSETETIQIVVDAKGRLSAVVAFDLNTDNITEGIVNLFFTVARARAAISGAAGVDYDSTTGIATLDQAFTRGLFSGGSGIDYNSGSGVIATTGFSGTVSPVLSITVIDGIVTAVS